MGRAANGAPQGAILADGIRQVDGGPHSPLDWLPALKLPRWKAARRTSSSQ